MRGDTMDGRPFGRYELLELLGSGEMGEVWRAFDNDTTRTVAVKILYAHLGGDQTFVQQFRREAQAVAKLYDPHIIPIHNYGEIDGRLYVDMRLIEGRGLDSLIAEGPLEPGRAVRIVEQVASALTVAHDAGLVHRDVKPANVLLGRNDFAYLKDFAIMHAAEGTRFGKAGMTLGTWAYMAPELFDSDAADARADIYALTCVLHECLTGKPPYAGHTLDELSDAHRSDPVPRPSFAVAAVPQGFDVVIATGMAKDPAQRYQSALDLAHSSRAALPLSAPPPPAAAPPPTIPTYQPVYTEPAPVYNASPTQRAPIPSYPPPAPPSSPPAQPRRRTPLVIAGAILAVTAVLAGALIFVATRGDSSQAPTATSAATPTTSSSPTSAAPAALNLDALLLGPAEVDAVMGATGLAVQSSASEPDDGTVVTPPQCHAVTYITGTIEYGTSAYIDMRWQMLGNDSNASVVQAVTDFGTPDQASSFVAAMTQTWQSCRNTSAVSNDRATGLDTTWLVGDVVAGPQAVTATMTLDFLPGFVCQHTLRAQAQVVIEVSACNDGVTNQAQTITDTIAGRVTD